MKTTLLLWLSIILALSFLAPIIGRGQSIPGNFDQASSIYLPIAINHPLGMHFIPAGEFWMGCMIGPCFYGSGAVHNVYLDDYFIDIYEVSNAKYALCVADGVCTPPAAYGSHSRDSYYDNPTYADYPVFHITWENATDYCQWLGKRLPTEAEWEKAAQGGFEYPNEYPWGDEAPVCTIGAPNGAQYDECSPDDSVRKGSFGPSHLGLYDMAGNVWEWVSDWYSLTYYSFSPYQNPQGPDVGTEKVIRGGSWNYMSYGLRWHDRNFRDPNTALGNHDLGFRCVFDPWP